jgi:hypothetical protein
LLTKCHSDFTHKYSEAEIEKILEFFMYNIKVVLGSQTFQHSIRIPMGTNCAPSQGGIYSNSSTLEKEIPGCGLQSTVDDV